MKNHPAHDFIDDDALTELLQGALPSDAELDVILEKSLSLRSLTVEETAILIRATAQGQAERIFHAARTLKKRVYGNRVVLFAPLYVGNRCVNDCTYCAFRRSNAQARRVTLTQPQIADEVMALEDAGHKRLVLVFGEHRDYSADAIAKVVEQVYSVRKGHGEIRRVNINAAPLDHEGFARLHAAGIGTFQVFQETYHHKTYARVHPAGTPKSDFLFRLDAPGRAIDAGQDDVGLGVLFGLHDWRFEVLGLVTHARYLQEVHGVGPHTLSFPRLRPALGVHEDPRWLVSDGDFLRIVAILRLAVPYTGLILTAREPAALRREVLALGVSQIDGGSRIDLGGYARSQEAREQEQFVLGDNRTLDEVLADLLEDGYLPSFCTACYRLGRTGEHFMEFAIPGFIKRFCTPNALCTLAEYARDYATPSTREAANRLIAEELARIGDDALETRARDAIDAIRENDACDVCF